jgi:hypothetical protein
VRRYGKPVYSHNKVKYKLKASISHETYIRKVWEVQRAKYMNITISGQMHKCGDRM